MHFMSGTLCVETAADGFLTESLQAHCEVCVVNAGHLSQACIGTNSKR